MEISVAADGVEAVSRAYALPSRPVTVEWRDRVLPEDWAGLSVRAVVNP